MRTQLPKAGWYHFTINNRPFAASEAYGLFELAKGKWRGPIIERSLDRHTGGTELSHR